MSEMPWVRFFPSDWLAGTRGMSAAETGIYITLVASMYERGEPIPEDHARLARLCGASNSTFKSALETLVSEGKIMRVEGGLWNDRVEKESVYRSEKSEVGKQAANARWQKSERKQSSNNASAMQSQCVGNANQNPDIRIEKEEPTGSSKKRGSRLPNDFQPDMRQASDAGLSQAEAEREALKFRDYWISQPGQKGVKLDWPATWRNWCRHAAERRPHQRAASPPKPKTIGDIFRDDAKRMGLIDDEPTDETSGCLDTGHGSGQGSGPGITRRFAVSSNLLGRIG